MTFYKYHVNLINFLMDMKSCMADEGGSPGNGLQEQSSNRPELHMIRGGKKLRIGLEDDVIVTENGVEYIYPEIDRILLIR